MRAGTLSALVATLLFAGVVLASAIAAPQAEAQRRRRDREAATAPGTLVIQGTQEGAEVFVDEQPVGTTPLAPITVAPGSHTIRVRLPGHTEYTDVVQVRPGAPTEVEVDLLALSQVLSVLTAPPGAHVYVDGDFMGETPVEFDLLEGPHSVRLVLRGHAEAIREIEARAGSRDELQIEMTALTAEEMAAGPDVTEWYEEPVTWIAVGGGAVAIAVVIAVVAVVATGSSTTQIDAFCGQPGGCIRLDPRW